jgi:allantoicase
MLIIHSVVLVMQGVKGIISKLEIDTNFFKGNYPESCMVRIVILGYRLCNSFLILLVLLEPTISYHTMPYDTISYLDTKQNLVYSQVETCVLSVGVSADELSTMEKQEEALGKAGAAGNWQVLLPRTRLGPGAQHFFSAADGSLNNVRVY